MKFNFVKENDMSFSAEKQEKAKALFSRFEKICTKDASCKVTLSKVTDAYIKVETAIFSGGKLFLASDTGEDYEVILNKVYEKLKKQLRRNKDKQLAKKIIA